MFVEDVKTAFLSHYTKARKGVRVSDLYQCIRKSVFSKLDPFPPNEEDMHRFMIGQAIHEKVQQILEKERPGIYSIEKEITYKVNDFVTVWGHIDVYDEIKQYPVDMKTRYVLPGQIEKDVIKQYEIQQLKWYMAITNRPQGIIARIFLNAKSKDSEPELFGWKEDIITFTNDLERDYHLQTLAARAENYSLALNTKNPKTAMHVMDDPEQGKYCNTCPYAVECYRMNHV